MLRGGSASPSSLACFPGESVNSPVDPSNPLSNASRSEGSAAMSDFLDDFGDGVDWMPDSPTLPLVEYCVPGSGQQQGADPAYNSSVLLRLLDVAAEYGGEKEVREAAAYMQSNAKDATKCAELLETQAIDRASSQRPTVQVLHLIYVANELLVGPKGVWTGLLTEVLTKLLPLACKMALRRDEKDVYRRIVDLPASVWVYPILPSATREKFMSFCDPDVCQLAPESSSWMGNAHGNSFSRAVSPSRGSPPPTLSRSPTALSSPPPPPTLRRSPTALSAPHPPPTLRRSPTALSAPPPPPTLSRSPTALSAPPPPPTLSRSPTALSAPPPPPTLSRSPTAHSSPPPPPTISRSPTALSAPPPPPTLRRSPTALSAPHPPPTLSRSPTALSSPPPPPQQQQQQQQQQQRQQQRMGFRAQPISYDHADAALNDLVEQSLHSGNGRSVRQDYAYPMRATRAPQAAYVPVSSNDSYTDGFFGGGSYGHLLGSRHLGGGLVGHAERGGGAFERADNVHADGCYGYLPSCSYANGWGGDATLTEGGPQRRMEGVDATTTLQARYWMDPRMVQQHHYHHQQQQQHQLSHPQRDFRAVNTHQRQALRDQFDPDTFSAWDDSIVHESAPYSLVPGRLEHERRGGQAWGPSSFETSRPEFDRPSRLRAAGRRHSGEREVPHLLGAGRECARRGPAEMENDVIDLDKWRPAPAGEITDASPNYTRVYPAATDPSSSSGGTHAYSMSGTAMLPNKPNKRRALNERVASNGAQREESLWPPRENAWGREEGSGGEEGRQRRETAYSTCPPFEQRSRSRGRNSKSVAPSEPSGHRLIPSGMFQSRGMFSTWKGHEGRAYGNATPPWENAGGRGGRSGENERGRRRGGETLHSLEIEAAEGVEGGYGNTNRERCVDQGLVEWLESMSADRQPSATPIPEQVDLTGAPGGTNVDAEAVSAKNGEEYCLEVKEDAGPDGDDVTVEWQEISLKCPLSQKRIEVGMACKGSNCKHVQCFDGMAWNSFQERARLSQARNNANKCPHCGKIIDQLVSSTVFDRILQDAPPGVDSVRIDSKWNVQPAEALSFEVAHVRDAPVDGGVVKRDERAEASDSSVIVID